MPEQPPTKRAYQPGNASLGGPNSFSAVESAAEVIATSMQSVPYAELHARTNFSFLEGASHPDELVIQAARLGYRALAITDRQSLAGIVRAHTAAKDVGLKLLIGAEITPQDAPPVVLLATDRTAYGRLCRLLTVGRRRAPKGECHLRFDDVAAHAEGLLALVLLAGRNAQGELVHNAPLTELYQVARYGELFGDRCYALAELHRGPDDDWLLDQFAQLARRSGVPLVAAGDVYYHVAGRRALADVLLAVRLGKTVDEATAQLQVNAQRYLRPTDEIAELFARHPAAVARTVEIAERATFSLDELRYEYPEELCPVGRTPREHLAELTWRGAHKRYPSGIPPKVRGLIEHELQLIAELRYEAYFLTVWDLVRFARSRNILCQGRGSAANSAVCYALGVTSVDPDRLDLLFERFVSREREEAPDIDVDFEHERREEVLQYLYEKYGRERAGMTAEVITYRSRSAVRDLGKALGLSLDRVEALSKTLDGYLDERNWPERCREAGVDPDGALGQRFVWLLGQLVGFPRHLSQHVGGMVITRGPLSELVPIENATMPDRTVIPWDKDDLDELGILKVDCLALGMLTAVHKCFDLVTGHTGRELELATVPPEDDGVYEMIDRADTIGVFQIESRAQMSMLPRLRPRTFYDLVIEVAIVRPGPIQGNMVHPYLRRRAGLEEVHYPSEAVREVLHKTLGVPIFQEQAMRLAIVAAGFTPGEADQLRRAMGGWRRPGVIEQFRQRLVEGMLASGLGEEFAERLFMQIRGFGEYGFPESHAASFALVVYVSAWLKCYYPAAFAAALINSQPMGFYAPAQLVRDAREHGVEVRGVDVNSSDYDCTLEPASQTACTNRSEFSRQRLDSQLALRLGLRMIRGLPVAAAETIVAARAAGPFRTLNDLARRTRLGRGVLVRLAKADALGSLRVNRRTGLWQALARPRQQTPLPLFDSLPDELAHADVQTRLPRLSDFDEVLADYRTAGLSLRAHPISFFRTQLERLGVVRAEQLPHRTPGKVIAVAGVVLVRQRPSTASGITFMTIEDETGVSNLVVRPAIWRRFRGAAANSAAIVARGVLEREGEVIHILVHRIEDMTELTGRLDNRSRDFQ